MSETRTKSKKVGTTTTAISEELKRSITHVTSDITSKTGEVNIKSGANTNILASNVTSNTDTNIKVGSYVDPSTSVETINNAATFNVLNGKDSEYSYSMNKKQSMDLGAVAMGSALSILTLGASAYAGLTAREGGVNMRETYDETIVASNIDAGNNLNIQVASDANVRSSNLTANAGDANIDVGQITDKNSIVQTTNSNAILNIASDTEKHIKNEINQKLSVDYGAIATSGINLIVNVASGMVSGYQEWLDKNGMALIGTIGGAVEGVKEGYESSSELASKERFNQENNNNIKQISSNINAANNVNINSTGEVNLVASNINSVNDAAISSTNKAINITSDIETSAKFTYSKKSDFTDVEANFKRGRGSVDFNMDKSKEMVTTSTSTNKASNINAGNDIILTANEDVKVAASNLVAQNNIDATYNVGDVNVISQANSSKIHQVKEDINMAVSSGIGNAYVDAAYAVDDAVKAAEAVKRAKDDLSHMKNLKKQGRATSEAVKDAKANLAMAILNYELAGLQATRAGAKAVSGGASSFGTGFYADTRLNTTTTKTTTNINSVTNVASNLVSDSGNINLTSTTNDINQTGSNIIASGGDVNYDAGGDVNIMASKNTYNYQDSTDVENSTITVASSNAGAVAMDNMALSQGYQKSDNKVSSITYNNSITQANNVNITSNNDTLLDGANVLATNDLIVNSGNDLIVKSKQSEYHAKGSSKGFNVGGGVSGNSYSFGFNVGKSNVDRVWVDDQTTLIANNSVAINTGNNTDITGALIANIDANNVDQGNLTLTTKTLTFEDLKDVSESKSSGFNFQESGLGKGQTTNSDTNNSTNQQNQYPTGSTTIGATNSGSLKEQVTKATIGDGTITITDATNTINSDITNLNRDITKAQEVTRDTITNSFDSEVTVDNRLFSAGGRSEVFREVADAPENLPKVLEGNALFIDKTLEAVGDLTKIKGQDTIRQVTSPVEGLIDYFYENDTKLYAKVNGEVRELTRDELKFIQNYAVNGIIAPQERAKNNYLLQEGTLVALRHNPSAGFLGDLVESGLGKTLGKYIPESSKMVREVTHDLYVRKDVEGGNNVFHSQGSIIGEGAMKYYDDLYQGAGNQINSAQNFVAVGPAVGKEDWVDTARLLKVLRDYQHDPNDPVQQLTSPTSPLDFGKGLVNMVKNFNSHDVTNYHYSYYLLDSNYIKEHNLPHPSEVSYGTDPRINIRKK